MATSTNVWHLFKKFNHPLLFKILQITTNSKKLKQECKKERDSHFSYIKRQAKYKNKDSKQSLSLSAVF